MTDNQAIPEDAVRLASWAVLRGINAGHHAYKIAYAALETAAPHLMAQAWDEAHFEAMGCDGSCCDFMHDAPKKTMNPYRSSQ